MLFGTPLFLTVFLAAVGRLFGITLFSDFFCLLAFLLGFGVHRVKVILSILVVFQYLVVFFLVAHNNSPTCFSCIF